MGNIPLHPLVVHLPLVLAVFLPVIVAAILWADWRGRLTRRSWWIGAVTAALLAGGAFVALQTGENEEERVEQVVAEAALETHEERAEVFLWATLAPLMLVVGAGLLTAPRARRWVGGAAVVASLAVAGLALGVGHSGGELVYVHNAGAAYADGVQTGARLGGDIEHDDR